MTKTEKDLLRFLAKYPGKWHTFKRDYETVSTVCALHNRGDCHVAGDQMISTSQGLRNAIAL